MRPCAVSMLAELSIALVEISSSVRGQQEVAGAIIEVSKEINCLARYVSRHKNMMESATPEDEDRHSSAIKRLHDLVDSLKPGVLWVDKSTKV